MIGLISNLIGRWWRPVTPQLSPDQCSLSDADLAWAAFDAASASLDAAGGPFGRKVRRLPPHWRCVWTLLYLHDQVCNGGFHQFFTNSEGLFDSHLSEDIAQLNHADYRAIIERALRAYRGMDYSDQWADLGKSWDKFASGYRKGRFLEEDAAYAAIEPDLDEVVGRHIRYSFNVYRQTDA